MSIDLGQGFRADVSRRNRQETAREDFSEVGDENKSLAIVNAAGRATDPVRRARQVERLAARRRTKGTDDRRDRSLPRPSCSGPFAPVGSLRLRDESAAFRCGPTLPLTFEMEVLDFWTGIGTGFSPGVLTVVVLPQ